MHPIDLTDDIVSWDVIATNAMKTNLILILKAINFMGVNLCPKPIKFLLYLRYYK